MIKVVLEVKNSSGLHARPSSLIARKMSSFLSEVKIDINNEFINAKSILELLSLCASCGTKLNFVINGDDENDVFKELNRLFDSEFNEAY